MSFENDPLGHLIHDYTAKRQVSEIRVESDLCDDDIIPFDYLIRDYDSMPDLEKKALSLVKGKVLDIGAGFGPHAIYLKEKGFELQAIDTSAGSVDYLQSLNIDAHCIDILSFNRGGFDTLLLLMNGIGIAGTLNQLTSFLAHLKTLLSKDGFILCESTDISYLYEEEDGSKWVDVNAAYEGEMNFRMHYKESKTDWFPWFYVDFNTLKQKSSELDLNCELIFKGETNNYLAKISHK